MPQSRKSFSKVLLLEDHSGWRMRLARIIQAAGIKVVTAKNKDSAQHRLGIDGSIDVIVTDVFIDGEVTAAQEICQAANCMGIPIIAISGPASRETVARLFAEFGVFAFLGKSEFDGDKLILEIRKALRSNSRGQRRAIAVEEVVMGDKYTAQNVLALGKNAHADHNTWNQLWTDIRDRIEFESLASELKILRDELKSTASLTPAADITIGHVAEAEQCALRKDGEGTLKALSQVGKWALDTATKIGTDVASKVIQTAILGPQS